MGGGGVRKSIVTEAHGYRARGDERIRTADLSGTIDPVYDRVADAVGNYLAGLTDGEGCFVIAPNRTDSYRCEFIIHLRADDRPLLEWLRDCTGLGIVREGRRVKVGGDQPSVRWSVAMKGQCLQLVALFERYPLRSKKAKDFAIWADACRSWARQDFGRMADLHVALRHARLFESAGEDWVVTEDFPQLVLEDA